MSGRVGGATVLVACFLLLARVGAAVGATLDVPSDFATIQGALDVAAAGDEVVVAPGTYSDTVVRETTEGMAEAVAFLTSGVRLRSSGGPGVTFVDGEGQRHCVVGEDLSMGTVLEGFTLLRGQASGAGGNGKWGGGALIFDSSMEILGNRFVECTAGEPAAGTGGGGLFLAGADGVVVASNLFLRCSAGQLGGGMEVFDSPWVEIRGNTFAENDGGDAGGGLLMNGMTGPVENNIFFRNVAALHDGGHGCIGIGNGGVTGACNLYWENTVGSVSSRNDCGFGPGVGGSLEADPLFCDPTTGDYSLSSGSPAAPPGPSGCGLIGAYPVACGPVSVVHAGWGTVKGLYR